MTVWRQWLRGAMLLLAVGAIALGSPPPAAAIAEADRLWLVGERAFRDGLHSLAARALARLAERHPEDKRVPEGTLLLAKARLAQGALEPALEAFRKAQRFVPVPGQPEEARFWEGETLFRLRRFEEARRAYDRLLAENAASPFAPDALNGLAWSELELQRREPAAKAFRQLIDAFPDHQAVPTATVALARLLVEQRPDEVATLLESFASRHADHRLLADARYLLGYARVAAGRTREGIADLRAFAAAHPAHELVPQARRIVVEALLGEDDRAGLAEEYATLMKLRPAAPELLYDAARIAVRLGQPQDAEAAWTALRRDFPQHGLAPLAALELAQGAYQREAFKEAATLARAAARSEERAVRAQALLLAGESELKQKRFAAAHEVLQEAVTAAGDDAAVRYRALAGSGLALEEQRQWAPALKYYEEVAEKSPDATLASWAKTRQEEMTARLKPAPAKGPSRSNLPGSRSRQETRKP